MISEGDLMERPIDFDLIRNARFPEGEFGLRMIDGMNQGHAALTDWGFSQVESWGKTILDVGCGGGAALRKLAEALPEATFWGCDISPLAVSASVEMNRENTLNGRMTFVVCGVSELPFESKKFDTVFSVESLYFWPNPKEDLKEISRVLKPGGRFMTVLEMVGGRLSQRHQAIAERLEMFCPTAEELENLFKESGFCVEKILHDTERGWLCGVGMKMN